MFPVELLLKCWFLAGPTACGKTTAALCLAERLNAEIIALDSMTIYRGMDLGTAKPTTEEQSRVPHHLLDILDPHEEFCLTDYVSAADRCCRDVISRGRVPLFVGGTGLYLRGLLRGVFDGPSADFNLRLRLENQARVEGPKSLHAQLQLIDPVSAIRLHPHDQRRIIRALEVFELTGRPLSTLQEQGARRPEQRPQHVYWLSPPRDWLHKRIDTRVEQMFADGLIDEVQRIVARPQALSQTARQALGYKEVIDWLERNPVQPAIDQFGMKPPPIPSADRLLTTLIQTRTRQFAKRQHTWFRNLVECRPVPISGAESPIEVAELVLNTSTCLPLD